jgi:hypothetical protein
VQLGRSAWVLVVAVALAVAYPKQNISTYRLRPEIAEREGLFFGQRGCGGGEVAPSRDQDIPKS